MKAKFFNGFIVFSFLILFILVISNKYLILNTVSYSLDVWVNSLVPVMFPVFVISDVLLSFNITNYIPKFIKKYFKKLFKVSENGLSIFFLSMLSGFPSNARLIAKMINEGNISNDEGQKLLAFTHFSNPMFVIFTIGSLFLGNVEYGYIILISHYLGNIIIGLVLRNNIYTDCINYKTNSYKSQSFSKVLIKAIKTAIDSLLLILGTLTCFLIVSSLIVDLFLLNDYMGAIVRGILEMTMGLKYVSGLIIPDIYKVVISCMFISFGGLAVHMQVLSQIIDSKIEYLSFFVVRIWHAIISGIICYVIYFLVC